MSELSKRESDLIKISEVNNKQEQIKAIQEKIQKIKQEVSDLDKRKKSFIAANIFKAHQA